MVDHTGREINIGQRASMDSGHSHSFNDRVGMIVEIENWPHFKYDNNGDEVPLTKNLCKEIEIIG